MDIVLLQASAYELPTSRRVGVIVHDGASDTRLWPGPGPDRELVSNYGPDLADTLDRERGARELKVGEIIRLHPGKLHCDFLLWASTRGPEESGRQAKAPDADVLRQVVRDVLEFVSERNAIRVAFPALGAGPAAIDDAERLALIAKTAHTWQEERFASGQASVIEEVIVCDPRLSVVASARRMASSVAKAPVDKPSVLSAAAPVRKTAERKPRATAARKPVAPRLDEAALGHARATAQPWDRTVRYSEGSWFIHAKFGVGQVQSVTTDDFIMVLFEDGTERKLIHGRS